MTAHKRAPLCAQTVGHATGPLRTIALAPRVLLVKALIVSVSCYPITPFLIFLLPHCAILTFTTQVGNMFVGHYSILVGPSAIRPSSAILFLPVKEATVMQLRHAAHLAKMGGPATSLTTTHVHA